MEERSGPNPYESMTPRLLRNEALFLFSQFPQSLPSRSARSLNIQTNRINTVQGNILTEKFSMLISRAIITPTFRSILSEEFRGIYERGEEVGELRSLIVGESDRKNLFDSLAARLIEYSYMRDWEYALAEGIISNPDRLNIGDIRYMLREVDRMFTKWKDEYSVLHPDFKP